MVVAHQSAPDASTKRLRHAGVEVLILPSKDDDTEHTGRPDLLALLKELGRREMTNILIEGGARLLGSFFDQRLIDECHVFIAPNIIGGTDHFSPVQGRGIQHIADALQLAATQIEIVDGDVYIHGPLGCPAG
jgi:diaminohydroxyphosphoribosylaminopyrimidine deaminase/5-amino-6-(5-phosphoribosylamino)uracil reductase